MTILSVAQDAAAKLVGRRPAAVVSSQGELEVELTALAQESAEEIATDYDWQDLVEFHTITADGEAESYPRPADYERMVERSKIFDPNNWAWGYVHVPNYSEWQFFKERRLGIVPPGIWQIRKNQFHFMPAPPVGRDAIFPYVTKNVFTDINGAPKARITADTDVFVLDERLLTQAIIWKWKQMKGFDYQQEIDDYNLRLNQCKADDKGARGIRSFGDPLYGFPTAYPWPLGA